MNLSKPVRVLLIVDEPSHAQRIQICLRQFKDIPLEVHRNGAPGEAPKRVIDSRSRDMNFEVTWVMSLAEALQKITEHHFDILILDLSLLDAESLSAIRSSLRFGLFHRHRRGRPHLQPFRRAERRRLLAGLHDRSLGFRQSGGRRIARRRHPREVEYPLRSFRAFFPWRLLR